MFNASQYIIPEIIPVYLAQASLQVPHMTSQLKFWLVRKISMAVYFFLEVISLSSDVVLSCLGVLGPLNILPSIHEPWGSSY